MYLNLHRNRQKTPVIDMPKTVKTFIAVISIALMAGALLYWQRGAVASLFGNQPGAPVAGPGPGSTCMVERQPLEVTITEVGALRAIKNHRIHAPEMLQRATLSWVIEENRMVEPGDRIIEFDSQPYKDQIEDLEKQIDEYKDQIQGASDDLAYFRKLNERDIRKSTEAVDKAADDLHDYRHNQATETRRDLQQKIIDAQRAYTTARQAYEEKQVEAAEASFDNGRAAKTMEEQLNSAREAMDKAQAQVRSAYTAYKEFKNKTYPEKVEQLQETLAKSRKSHEEAIKIAAADEEKYKSKIRSGEESIERARKSIEENREKIENCVLTAPVEGVVLYGDPEMPQYRQYIRNSLKPGQRVHSGGRMALLTIPDFSEFVIDIPVGEQYRGRITREAPAEITVDAVPGEQFTGLVKSISTVSKPRNPAVPSSPKVYGAVVTLDAQDDRLVSGMTARVAITTDHLKNVIAVPIEAVFNQDGETVCYVDSPGGPTKRPVTTGKLNDDFVQIKDGLEEDEEIWLHRPDDSGS